jgi:hypothetical protein
VARSRVSAFRSVFVLVLPAGKPLVAPSMQEVLPAAIVTPQRAAAWVTASALSTGRGQ